MCISYDIHTYCVNICNQNRIKSFSYTDDAIKASQFFSRYIKLTLNEVFRHNGPFHLVKATHTQLALSGQSLTAMNETSVYSALDCFKEYWDPNGFQFSQFKETFFKCVQQMVKKLICSFTVVSYKCDKKTFWALVI